MPKLIFRGASIRFVDLRYDDKSKTTYTKLNFTTQFSGIVTSVDEAAALAEQYLRTIGIGEAQLRVNYEQQEELDIAPAEEVQESLETSEDGAALASVTTMGGSHQKKGRK